MSSQALLRNVMKRLIPQIDASTLVRLKIGKIRDNNDNPFIIIRSTSNKKGGLVVIYHTRDIRRKDQKLAILLLSKTFLMTLAGAGIFDSPLLSYLTVESYNHKGRIKIRLCVESGDKQKEFLLWNLNTQTLRIDRRTTV